MKVAGVAPPGLQGEHHAVARGWPSSNYAQNVAKMDRCVRTFFFWLLRHPFSAEIGSLSIRRLCAFSLNEGLCKNSFVVNCVIAFAVFANCEVRDLTKRASFTQLTSYERFVRFNLHLRECIMSQIKTEIRRLVHPAT